MAIKTRDQIASLVTQCGGLNYKNFMDFLSSIMFRSDPDNPITPVIPTPSNETFIII